MQDIKETIRQFILVSQLPGESPGSLRDDTPLQTSGILDSLATVGLVSFIEKHFGVELDVYDTSVERFDSIDNIAATILRKRVACET
jgi:acyl carrier protein